MMQKVMAQAKVPVPGMIKGTWDKGFMIWVSALINRDVLHHSQRKNVVPL